MTPAEKYRDNFKVSRRGAIDCGYSVCFSMEVWQLDSKRLECSVHERLLRNVRCELQELYDVTNMEQDEYKEFVKTFNLWVKSLPKLAKEQLALQLRTTQMYLWMRMNKYLISCWCL